MEKQKPIHISEADRMVGEGKAERIRYEENFLLIGNSYYRLAWRGGKDRVTEYQYLGERGEIVELRLGTSQDKIESRIKL